MAGRAGVAEVHDLHIWDVTSGMPALSAHVLVDPTGDCHDVRRDIEVLLKGTYRIDHTTLQVDHADSTSAAGSRPGRPGLRGAARPETPIKPTDDAKKRRHPGTSLTNPEGERARPPSQCRSSPLGYREVSRSRRVV